MRIHPTVAALAVSAMIVTARAPAQPAEGLVNAERRAAAVPVLAVDPILTAAAADYAAVLAKAGALSHRDAAGNDAAARVRRAGGTLTRVGEVLGAGPDVRAVVAAWRESAAHRTVMLRRGWTHLGIATAHRGESLVVVALFARRLHEDVTVHRSGDVLVLRGRSLTSGSPVAVTLSRVYRAALFDEVTGRWEMRFSPGAVPLTVRLGVIGADGSVETAHVVYPRADAQAQ